MCAWGFNIFVHSLTPNHVLSFPIRACSEHTIYVGCHGESSAHFRAPQGDLPSPLPCFCPTASVSAAVCIEPFDQQQPGLLLSECKGHYIHAACALEVFTALGPKCPTCSIMYGELHGECTQSVFYRPLLSAVLCIENKKRQFPSAM